MWYMFIYYERSQEEKEHRSPELAGSFWRQVGEGRVIGGLRERANWSGEVRSIVRQYLQEWEPGLAEGRIEKQSLSPHRHCQPTPNDAPDRKTEDDLVIMLPMKTKLIITATFCKVMEVQKKPNKKWGEKWESHSSKEQIICFQAQIYLQRSKNERD